MSRRYLTILTTSVLLALTLSGCGSRPSQEDFTKALQKGVSVTAFGGVTVLKYDAKQAKCVADVLRASELSDATLDQIIKPTKSGRASKADQQALTAAGKKLQACAPDTPNALVTRPTAEAIAAGFEKGLRGYAFGSKVMARAEGTKAKCLGETLAASKVSNLTIAKMLSQDEKFQAPPEDVKSFKAISTELNTCVKPELGGSSSSPTATPAP